ncbi:MAG: imidazole glycerol phosphate synthase subunit HisH [Lachnospiraceae bacterium]|nr:imidazole glycerol phosphate synthase subunit HisH [Lachnospiraceae bacterium]
MITVIDYDAGNTQSVCKALEYLGYNTELTGDCDAVKSASHLLLPGVGAFGQAMDNLKKRGLDEAIKEYVKSGKPFLGICLGMQLLFSESKESPDVKGLSLFDNSIELIPGSKEFKVPHIGWNSLDIKENSRLFKGIRQGDYVYFVHSFYLPGDFEHVCASSDYSVKIGAAVEHENVFGCQFHPEKSGETGLRILDNFAKMK